MAADSPNVLTLPIASIQHDFQNVVSDVRDGIVPSEDIWLSCYRTGSPSVHGKVRIQLGERREGDSGSRAVELVPREGVHLEKAEKGNYVASCDALSIPPTTIHMPRYVVRDSGDSLKSKQINAIAVAPDLSQISLGYENGSIRRLPLSLHPNDHSDSTEASVAPLTYTPHLSSAAVETLSYFPSSRVLLSGGADFTLHVLDADPALSAPPKPVRTLKGHIRAVSGVVIIDRGKNVLSGARDGTLRLWDISSGKQIRMFGSQKYSPINALALGIGGSPTHPPSSSLSTDGENRALEPDPREIGTADKHAFIALQNGDFEYIDLGSKSSIFHSSTMQEYQKHGPLTAIAYDSGSSLLVTGSSSGVVTAFDMRFLSAPLCAFQRNSAGIQGLAFIPHNPTAALGHEASSEAHHEGEPDLAVVTADGLPFIASIRPNGPEVRFELAGGGDCEPLRALTIDSNGGVWLAGDEGIARMY